MRALVVGLGSIGRRHARNWAALGLGPLAVCRQTQAAQPEPLGVQATEYRDLAQALEREQPDVVLVTNPTSLHVETAQTAVDAGAHVFVEKPLGSSLEGVSKLLVTARDNKRLVMVGYNLRFHPGLVRLKALANAGAIGKIVSARAEVGEYLPDWHPWEDHRASYSGRRDLGGGVVLTFSHELDALCWLLGPPRRLMAMTARVSSLDVETEAVAEIGLEFASGALGSVHVDYIRRPPQRTLELVGEQGVLRLDLIRNRLEHYAAANRQWRVEEGDPRFQRNHMYVAELCHLVACARGEVPKPLVDGEQGAAILSIALAALRSAATGQAVDFGDESQSPDGQVRMKWLSSFA
jgi:predicted dehydrogenase